MRRSWQPTQRICSATRPWSTAHAEDLHAAPAPPVQAPRPRQSRRLGPGRLGSPAVPAPRPRLPRRPARPGARRISGDRRPATPPPLRPRRLRRLAQVSPLSSRGAFPLCRPPSQTQHNIKNLDVTTSPILRTGLNLREKTSVGSVKLLLRELIYSALLFATELVVVLVFQCWPAAPAVTYSRVLDDLVLETA